MAKPGPVFYLSIGWNGITIPLSTVLSHFCLFLLCYLTWIGNLNFMLIYMLHLVGTAVSQMSDVHWVHGLTQCKVGSWWHHQMETFSALLALCAGNSPVTGEYPAQRPVTRSFDIFFDLCLNKRLSKQSWGWWFETPSRSLWRHCNAMFTIVVCSLSR